MNRDAIQIKTAVELGPLTLFPFMRLLERNGAPVAIGSRALDILIVLVEREGTIVSKKELMARVWPGINVEESCLRVHIAGLRRSIGDNDAQFVKNVPGRGYFFVSPINWERRKVIFAAQD